MSAQNPGEKRCAPYGVPSQCLAKGVPANFSSIRREKDNQDGADVFRAVRGPVHRRGFQGDVDRLSNHFG
jgi:hypothetical protein